MSSVFGTCLWYVLATVLVGARAVVRFMRLQPQPVAEIADRSDLRVMAEGCTTERPLSSKGEFSDLVMFPMCLYTCFWLLMSRLPLFKGATASRASWPPLRDQTQPNDYLQLPRSATEITARLDTLPDYRRCTAVKCSSTALTVESLRLVCLALSMG